MKVLSVDPGMSGAAVLIGDASISVRRDFKHPEDMSRAIDELAPFADVAVIELVASRPGQGVASMFSFGHAAGVMLGSFYANGFSTFDARKKRLVEVSPLKWKNYFWDLKGGRVPDTPFDSVKIAGEFYPASTEFLTRVKDHNTADAVLMALWYILEDPEYGSLRKKDKDRLGWLLKRFNASMEKT